MGTVASATPEPLGWEARRSLSSTGKESQARGARGPLLVGEAPSSGSAPPASGGAAIARRGSAEAARREAPRVRPATPRRPTDTAPPPAGFNAVSGPVRPRRVAAGVGGGAKTPSVGVRPALRRAAPAVLQTVSAGRHTAAAAAASVRATLLCAIAAPCGRRGAVPASQVAGRRRGPNRGASWAATRRAAPQRWPCSGIVAPAAAGEPVAPVSPVGRRHSGAAARARVPVPAGAAAGSGIRAPHGTVPLPLSAREAWSGLRDTASAASAAATAPAAARKKAADMESAPAAPPGARPTTAATASASGNVGGGSSVDGRAAAVPVSAPTLRGGARPRNTLGDGGAKWSALGQEEAGGGRPSDERVDELASCTGVDGPPGRVGVALGASSATALGFSPKAWLQPSPSGRGGSSVPAAPAPPPATAVGVGESPTAVGVAGGGGAGADAGGRDGSTPRRGTASVAP